MKKLRYTFKSDILFKMVFVRYPSLLKAFVSAVLEVPVESITDFEIINPEMTPAHIESKFCRLDINMRVNGKRIDIEMQMANEGNYPERVMFYWARDYSSALPAGEDYSTLPGTMIVSILDFELFECAEYHSCFKPLEVTRHTLLSDKMGFYFFELPKLPSEIDRGERLILWLSLFNANTEEELERIDKMGVSVMSEAVNAYRNITTLPEYRELERIREKARHDEAQALNHTRQIAFSEGIEQGIGQGIAIMARKLLKRGRPVEEIMEDTGLSYEEIEELRTSHTNL